MEELSHLHGSELLESDHQDVTAHREWARMRRLGRLAAITWLVVAWLAWRSATNESFLPHISLADRLGPQLIILALLACVLILPMWGAGRSPHVLYRPSEIEIGLDDVVGADVVREEVVRTLNLFLAHKTVRDRLGGTPRRGVLFEGPPGTGKTYMAKAMAQAAGVPFLFVSASAFQSMYYGQTNRKIRSYFRELRKAARAEGGAIGFIEEIDAIGGARSGMGSSTSREGISGVVNELLIQLQSFDEPTRGARLVGRIKDALNSVLPSHAQLTKAKPAPANVLVVAATNRAADLDPALLRPGRFDRVIHFDLPNRSERRAIIDFYLDRKSHSPELDNDRVRDDLAAATAGYSPVMIEHVLDEALVWALRRGCERFDRGDVQRAKLAEEVGLGHPVAYTDRERLVIATHEAGHATVAYLTGRSGPGPDDSQREGVVVIAEEPIRRLEVLSIIKRRDALGLLGHGDDEERFTKSQRELRSLLRISFGGMVAEEIAFGEVSTGPSGDLAAATKVAAQMVGSFGMGGSLLSLEASSGGALGGDVVSKVLADDRSREAAEGLLVEAKAEATELLLRNGHIHRALRDALLERDELVGGEILEVIEEAIVQAELAELDLRTS